MKTTHFALTRRVVCAVFACIIAVCVSLVPLSASQAYAEVITSSAANSSNSSSTSSSGSTSSSSSNSSSSDSSSSSSSTQDSNSSSSDSSSTSTTKKTIDAENSPIMAVALCVVLVIIAWFIINWLKNKQREKHPDLYFTDEEIEAMQTLGRNDDFEYPEERRERLEREEAYRKMREAEEAEEEDEEEDDEEEEREYNPKA